MEGENWSRFEVESAVADYFHMFRSYLLGQKFQKAEHRRALQKKLEGRSEKSIDYKYRNISAVLRDIGSMWLPGYKPADNYQGLLAEVVADSVRSDRTLDIAAMAAVQREAEVPVAVDFDRFIVERPSPGGKPSPGNARPWLPVKVDYVERETRNRSLGESGERIVVAYERARLASSGRPDLAAHVDHVSLTKGDGLGYDIRSFDTDGQERFIEVKTTSFVALTPFYVSRREKEFSEKEPDTFAVYRLFDFRKRPRMFVLPGAIATHCRLDSISWQATLR